jgi:hypothetical protein
MRIVIRVVLKYWRPKVRRNRRKTTKTTSAASRNGPNCEKSVGIW